MSAMWPLSFECGSDTVSWNAEFALRSRVSRSATGSVMVMEWVSLQSPGFGHRRACALHGGRPVVVRVREAEAVSRLRHSRSQDLAQMSKLRQLEFSAAWNGNPSA